MLKNRVTSAFALVLLLGAAACGDDVAEEPVVEEAVPMSTETEQVAPAVIEGTIVMDTVGAGTIIDTTTATPTTPR